MSESLSDIGWRVDPRAVRSPKRQGLEVVGEIADVGFGMGVCKRLVGDVQEFVFASFGTCERSWRNALLVLVSFMVRLPVET